MKPSWGIYSPNKVFSIFQLSKNDFYYYFLKGIYSAISEYCLEFNKRNGIFLRNSYNIHREDNVVFLYAYS